MKKKFLSVLLAIQMMVMVVMQSGPMIAAASAPPSAALEASQVAVFNIAGADGLVKVTGLNSSDTVSVYSDLSGSSPIASANADATGIATVDIGTSALAPTGGTVYVTVKSSSYAESPKTAIPYQQQILPWQIYSHTGNWGENYQWSTSSNRKTFSGKVPDGTQAKAPYSPPAGSTYYPAYPTLNDSNGNPYTDDDLSHNVFLNKHIVIKGTGSRVTFYGYGYSGYNDFAYLPIADTNEKDVSFDFDLSTVCFHTLYGAGFLFNVKDNGNGTISGYSLLFHGAVEGSSGADLTTEDTSARSIELYKLTNVNKSSLNNSTSSTTFAGATAGISKITSLNVSGSDSSIYPAGGSFLNNNEHYIQLQIKQVSVSGTAQTELVVKDAPTKNGTYTTVMDDNALAPANGSGVGLIASYIKHGCSILSYLTFNNVTINTVNNDTSTPEGWPIIDLSASSGSARGQAALTFTAPTDASSVILQQSTDGTTWTTATTSSPILPGSSSTVVTGLENGTAYYFRLLVDGGSYAGISNSTTTTPSGTQTPVTVTFNSGDADTAATPASEVVNPVTQNLGTLPTPPLKAGYAFVGWSTYDGAATANFDANTTVTTNTTVYPVWSAYTANATPMYLNYGASTPATGTTGGTASAVSDAGSCTWAATPASGYTFIGWYADSACTGQVSTSSPYTAPLTGNTDYYALFKQTPTISISQQPGGASYHVGDTATALHVNVAATSGGTVKYQWYESVSDSNTSGQPIDGATTDTYTPSTGSEGTTYYYCITTETAAGWSPVTATSYTAEIAVSTPVKTPVSISETPSSVTYGDHSFELTAGGGDGTGDYIWSVTGSAVSLVPGGTNNNTAEVTITSAGTFDIRVYRQGDPTNQASTGTVTVNPKAVTIIAAAAGKTYDGTAIAAFSGTPSIHGVIAGDDVRIKDGTASFDTADAGTGKNVTFTGFSLIGQDSGNYILPAQPAAVTADITPARITITPVSGQQKYIGTQDPTLTYTSGGAASGETPVFTGALTRANGEAAGNYLISLGSLALANQGAFKSSNYSLSLSGTQVYFKIAALSGTPVATLDGPNGANNWFSRGVSIHLAAPDGYRISSDGHGWSDSITVDNTDGTGKAADYYLRRVSDGATTGVMTSASYKVDSASPTGTITIGTNIWNSFLNVITFGHFFKDTQTVNIAPADTGSGIADVQYLLSNEPISDGSIASASGWAEGSSFSITPDCKKIVYAKITDNAGNVAYISSDGMVFDATPPTITASVSGSFTNGHKTVSAACADSGSGVASVMWLPGSYTAGTFDIGGANSLSGGSFNVTSAGTYTIFAVDNAGNTKVETVTVPKDDQAGFAIRNTGAKTFGDPSFTLSTTGGSGDGEVTFSVPANNGVVTLSGNTINIIGTGTVTVTATKGADAQFDAADATYPLVISPLTYSVTASAYYKSSADTAYQQGNVGGTATAKESSVIAGDNATLTARPASGYVFDGWFASPGAGTPITTDLTFTPKINENSAYYACFSEVGYTVSGKVVDDQQIPQPVSGALIDVTLAGATVAGPVSTDVNGDFSLAGVPAGIYNLVVNYTDSEGHHITVTQIITISGNLTLGKITIPTGQKNTVFVPTSGPTVDAVANLDSVYQNVNGNTDPTLGVTQSDLQTVADGGSVTVRVVTSAVDSTAQQRQIAAMSAAVQRDSKIIGMQLDISAFKQVTPLALGTTTTQLSQLNNLITIYIPLNADLLGKSGYVVYRYHNGLIDKITETPNAAGEYFTINNHMLLLTVQKFCVYSLAYSSGQAHSAGQSIPNPATGDPSSPLPFALAIFPAAGLTFVFGSKVRRIFRVKKNTSGTV